ncbi:hypothetical protein J1N35_021599 [Gossypium stocksii]|uniref:Uncharacterized protein n=1 Tax=Gossypium stocksii TaxID=47602 RepID=A0A9D3VF15_9ROSI|nr:hypothetical protein J1N35_021599 [Gossypium stocksii]
MHHNIGKHAANPYIYCPKKSDKKRITKKTESYTIVNEDDILEGNTRTLNEKHIAGEVMFEFVDMMVCHADSFFMGNLIPTISMDELSHAWPNLLGSPSRSLCMQCFVSFISCSFELLSLALNLPPSTSVLALSSTLKTPTGQ